MKTVFLIFDTPVLFFSWHFPLTPMKINDFWICYEAGTFVHKDKSEGKCSFKGVCNGIWAS